MMKKYLIEDIRKKSENVLINNGYSADNASTIIDSMIEADINGVSTHGIKMLIPYLDKIKKGRFNIKDCEILLENETFTIVDANNVVGALSAMFCVSTAIKKAERNGIHIVFSRNSNTYGPAFYYTEKMAERGFIGFTCCNSPAAMPAVNGLEPMLGTNPFSFSCPSKNSGILTIDMATSAVAKSKFEMYRIEGKKLEYGWALDKNGNPTTDPVEAINGLVLPMAGFKGYGISLIIDILSGLLSGAGYLKNVRKFYSDNSSGMNVGHLFVAIDPHHIYGDSFYDRFDDYLKELRDSKCKNNDTIIIPGDDRKRFKNKTLLDGYIEIPDEVATK